MVYVRLGRIEKARAEVAKYLEAYPDRILKDIRQFDPYKYPAQIEPFPDDMRRAGLPEEPPRSLPDKTGQTLHRRTAVHEHANRDLHLVNHRAPEMVAVGHLRSCPLAPGTGRLPRVEQKKPAES
jgi:hypothetical protein